MGKGKWVSERTWEGKMRCQEANRGKKQCKRKWMIEIGCQKENGKRKWSVTSWSEKYASENWVLEGKRDVKLGFQKKIGKRGC